ncbi:Com family DNA-binding transcriptional regulator [Glaciimonas sp. GG7]
MQDIRCGTCSRKLGEGDYIALAIKCPRCGTLNQFNTHPLRATRPAPACRRASESGVPHGCKSDHSMAGRQAPSG